MATPRKTLDEILDQARHLPENERRQLLDELQADQVAPPSESRRKSAMRRWLARAGTGHADMSDVSSHKNAHLAEITKTRP